jgi:hypothetical protein
MRIVERVGAVQTSPRPPGCDPRPQVVWAMPESAFCAVAFGANSVICAGPQAAGLLLDFDAVAF